MEADTEPTFKHVSRPVLGQVPGPVEPPFVTDFVTLVHTVGMDELKGLLLCETCGAAVPGIATQLHHNWHARMRP